MTTSSRQSGNPIGLNQGCLSPLAEIEHRGPQQAGSARNCELLQPASRRPHDDCFTQLIVQHQQLADGTPPAVACSTAMSATAPRPECPLLYGGQMQARLGKQSCGG